MTKELSNLSFVLLYNLLAGKKAIYDFITDFWLKCHEFVIKIVVLPIGNFKKLCYNIYGTILFINLTHKQFY